MWINISGPGSVRDWMCSTRGLQMIHGVSKDSVNITYSGGGTWMFPHIAEHILTHWTPCFMGPPQPRRPEYQREPTGHLLDPWVMIPFHLICISVTLFLSTPCFFRFVSTSHLLLNKILVIDFSIWSVCTLIQGAHWRKVLPHLLQRHLSNKQNNQILTQVIIWEKISASLGLGSNSLMSVGISLAGGHCASR